MYNNYYNYKKTEDNLLYDKNKIIKRLAPKYLSPGYNIINMALIKRLFLNLAPLITSTILSFISRMNSIKI